jgi:hypothetical protein
MGSGTQCSRSTSRTGSPSTNESRRLHVGEPVEDRAVLLGGVTRLARGDQVLGDMLPAKSERVNVLAGHGHPGGRAVGAPMPVGVLDFAPHLRGDADPGGFLEGATGDAPSVDTRSHLIPILRVPVPVGVVHAVGVLAAVLRLIGESLLPKLEVLRPVAFAHYLRVVLPKVAVVLQLLLAVREIPGAIVFGSFSTGRHAEI